MGVCINYKLGQEKVYIKKNLDDVQSVAEYYKKDAKKLKIKFAIQRASEFELYIDIGDCETLGLRFRSVSDILSDYQDAGWAYDWAVLTDNGKIELDAGYETEKYPKNEKWYCAGFTKTQFCKNIIEHKWVADLIRTIASKCRFAEINDEGDYYYSGDLNDAFESIKENGALISSVGGMLAGLGYAKENIIKGGETAIKHSIKVK